MNWPWVSRRTHTAALAEMEQDALLALRMAVAEGDPEGWGWSEKAARLWAEVHDVD